MQKFYSLILLLFTFQISAQDNTFDGVVSILNENGCSNSYCHGGGTGGFSLSGSSSDIYDALVGAIPSNEISSEKGDKIVDPGYPERSLLYRKINHSLYADSQLEEGEGNAMPDGTQEISDRDKEYIRQWIYYGAPETGKAFSDDVKEAFEVYHEEGGIEPIEVPPAPAAGEGFQVHLGPIFLQPGEETEYLKKYALRLGEDVEVNRIENFMSGFSHHFILYKFSNPSQAAQRNEGLREVSLGGDNPFGSGSDFVAIWQDEVDYRLPEGTAYKWSEEEVLDLNFHIKNYSTTQMLAADVYFNVYTQPDGTAEKEMVSELVINPAIVLFPGSEEWLDHSFTGSNDGFSGQLWSGNANLWMMTSHTHKLGKDYDVYLGGDETGVQLFEGQYDTEYTQFVGEYDYEHPPVRYFDGFLELPDDLEMTQRALYINDGNSLVTIGLTTDDEMMILAVQYTVGDNHQEDMAIREDLPQTVCEGMEPFELISNYDGGPVGNGVLGNMFYPELAGLGTHEVIINCCNPADQTSLMIEVKEFAFDAPEITQTGTEEAPIFNFVLEDPDLETEEYEIRWYLNGELIVGENEESLMGMGPGVYYTEIGSPNGCSARSADITIEEEVIIDSGIGDLSEHALSLSPNPFIERSNLFYELTETSFVKVELFDLSGKLIKEIFVGEQGSGEYNLKIETDQPSGVYLLKTKIGETNYTQKLIRQ